MLGKFPPYHVIHNPGALRLIDGHPILVDVYIAVLRVKKISQFYPWTRMWQSPLPATMDTMDSFVLCYREMGISRLPSSHVKREPREDSRYWSLFPGRLAPFGPGIHEALNRRDVLGYLRIAEDVENCELYSLSELYYNYYNRNGVRRWEPMFPEDHIFDALKCLGRSKFLTTNPGSWCKKAFIIQFKQIIAEWTKKESERFNYCPRQLDFPSPIYLHDWRSRSADRRRLSAYRKETRLLCKYRNEEIWREEGLIEWQEMKYTLWRVKDLIRIERWEMREKDLMRIEQEIEEKWSVKDLMYLEQEMEEI